MSIAKQTTAAIDFWIFEKRATLGDVAHVVTAIANTR